jgi:hypothetical protein
MRQSPERSCETHVIGQKQAPAREKPFNAVALITIERKLEGAERVVQMLPRVRGLDLAREPYSLFLQQRVQCRLAVTVSERGKQSIDEFPPLQQRFGNSGRPAVASCCTQPAPQIAVGYAVHPANALQPVAGAGQRTDRVPTPWRLLGSHPALGIAARPL